MNLNSNPFNGRRTHARTQQERPRLAWNFVRGAQHLNPGVDRSPPTPLVGFSPTHGDE